MVSNVTPVNNPKISANSNREKKRETYFENPTLYHQFAVQISNLVI